MSTCLVSVLWLVTNKTFAKTQSIRDQKRKTLSDIPRNYRQVMYKNCRKSHGNAFELTKLCHFISFCFCFSVSFYFWFRSGELSSINFANNNSTVFSLNSFYHQQCTWILDSKVDRQLFIEVSDIEAYAKAGREREKKWTEENFLNPLIEYSALS